MIQEDIDQIHKEVQKQNPGVETWWSQHPKTGDVWFYRPATKPEVRIYSKTLKAEQEKEDAGDKEVAYRVLIDTCVLWPPKAKDDRWTAEINPTGETIEKLLARRPLIPSVIAGDICVVSGFTQETLAKKL